MKTKICTDIEQSKKLIELGIDVNTADMTYISMKDYGENTYHLTVGKTDVNWAKDELGNLNWNDVYEKYIPAWSLSALLGLMPFHIIENNNRFGFYQVKGFNKQGETYRFGYKTNNDSFLFETSWHNDIIDAAFEMICWLKENNKI